MLESKRRKALASLAALAVLCGLATYGILGAFTAETVNSGNRLSSATLELTSSNDATTEPVYFAENAVPGDPADTEHSCVEITYTGTVPAEVRMYGETISTGSGLAPGVMLRITEGEGGVGSSCQGFVPDGQPGDVFGGSSGESLQEIRNFNGDYVTGFQLGTWNPGDSHVFRFESWLSESVDPITAQGSDAGNQSFVWEARAGA